MNRRIAVLLGVLLAVFAAAPVCALAQDVDATWEDGAAWEADATQGTDAMQETDATQGTGAVQEADAAQELVVELESASGQDASVLQDGSYETFASFEAGETLGVTAANGTIGGLYICWYTVPDAWTLSYTDAAGMTHRQTCGLGGYLHEYVQLEGSGATSCTLEFSSDAAACTLEAFGPGQPPAGVQTWNAPCDRADFLVCSTHADDEILWLGGVLATYAGGRGLSTQVVYMTNYWNGDIRREHEKLDGLWALGVRNYPVNALFEDIYAESLDYAQEVYDQDAVTSFFTEQVRRFKPLVVVCQDFGGEYGHGGHQVLALAVQGAVDHGADASFDADSAQAYGTWDVPKTYYHLYGENPITLDLHQPIANLGGLTAIEAQREAYKKHTSQQWTWFYVSDDPDDPNASQVNCADFGLYRSTVGLDTTNDMLEHVTIYEEQDAQAAQQAAQQQADAEAAAAAAAANAQSSDEQSVVTKSVFDGLPIPIHVIALIVAIVVVVAALLVLFVTR